MRKKNKKQYTNSQSIDGPKLIIDRRAETQWRINQNLVAFKKLGT